MSHHTQEMLHHLTTVVQFLFTVLFYCEHIYGLVTRVQFLPSAATVLQTFIKSRRTRCTCFAYHPVSYFPQPLTSTTWLNNMKILFHVITSNKKEKTILINKVLQSNCMNTKKTKKYVSHTQLATLTAASWGFRKNFICNYQNLIYNFPTLDT